MGSITMYRIINPNNKLVTIKWKCVGDYGDVEEGEELSFPYNDMLNTRYDLANNRFMSYKTLQDIKRDLELIQHIQASSVFEDFITALKSHIAETRKLWSNDLSWSTSEIVRNQIETLDFVMTLVDDAKNGKLNANKLDLPE